MTDAKTAMVEACRTVFGAGLRDVWVFDRAGYEGLYVREDVAAALETVPVEDHIDNERYGYVTRDIYEELYYATYRYTVRGFDEFQQVRLFTETSDSVRIGMLVSVDHDDRPTDFDALYERARSVVGQYPIDALGPATDTDGSAVGAKESA